METNLNNMEPNANKKKLMIIGLVLVVIAVFLLLKLQSNTAPKVEPPQRIDDSLPDYSSTP